ncbi:MAG TPA: DoxX family protein [Anaerolineae bacterium]|nr:DoxX family protein [Anaerolineae bacterium]
MMADNSKITFLVGRMVVGFFYLYAGINNFVHFEEAVGYAAFKGVPVTVLAVTIANILLLIAGLSILSGYQPVVGVTAVVLFMIPVTLLMHNFWAIADPQMAIAEMRSFLSNMGLAGSSLLFLAIPRPWPMSINKLSGKTKMAQVYKKPT